VAVIGHCVPVIVTPLGKEVVCPDVKVRKINRIRMNNMFNNSVRFNSRHKSERKRFSKTEKTGDILIIVFSRVPPVFDFNTYISTKTGC